MRPRYRLLREVAVASAEPGAASTAGAGAPNGTAASAGAAGASPAVSAEWRNQIPEAIRADKLWERHKDPASVFQSYHEAQKTIGGMVRLPGKDAKPEEVAAFREKLGVPKSAADYPAPAVPEGQTLDEARWDRWRGHAHKLGLTPEQLSGLATLEAEERAGALNGVRQEWGAGIDKLKAEWGPDLFAKKATLAARAVDRHMSPEGKAFLDASGLGDHPELLKAWASIGELLAEDGYIEGRVAGMPSPDAARARIAEIRAMPEYRQGGRRAEPLQAEMDNLYKGIYGTKDVSSGV